MANLIVAFFFFAILRTRLKIDIVGLVACWIPLNVEESHDSQNAVSGTLPYATSVTWPAHTPICRA
jgi:hypothetical protein